MRGKIICIEGNDRVGKHTQSMLLTEYIRELGYEVQCISFPNYGTPQAKPVESYLAGDFPSLGPLEASMLYAFDRSVTLKDMNIIEFINNGGIAVMDRYTTSNIVFQVARFVEERGIDNLTPTDIFNLVYKIEELEYNILKIPRPDIVIYLELNRELNRLLVKNNMEIKGNNPNDFHESNESLLDQVARTGMEIAKMSNWNIVECYDYDHKQIRTKEAILQDIIQRLLKNSIISDK